MHSHLEQTGVACLPGKTAAESEIAKRADKHSVEATKETDGKCDSESKQMSEMETGDIEEPRSGCKDEPVIPVTKAQVDIAQTRKQTKIITNFFGKLTLSKPTPGPGSEKLWSMSNRSLLHAASASGPGASAPKTPRYRTKRKRQNFT
ncbi:hypothetical protein FS749_005574 [Ceratobasidium sp. UAMH 11750]|nr:hypothetical protein FS749_005574 [Ceratobasidium sp. UAMH 11750]